jgi:hypothetical protein
MNSPFEAAAIASSHSCSRPFLTRTGIRIRVTYCCRVTGCIRWLWIQRQRPGSGSSSRCLAGGSVVLLGLSTPTDPATHAKPCSNVCGSSSCDGAASNGSIIHHRSGLFTSLSCQSLLGGASWCRPTAVRLGGDTNSPINQFRTHYAGKDSATPHQRFGPPAARTVPRKIPVNVCILQLRWSRPNGNITITARIFCFLSQPIFLGSAEQVFSARPTAVQTRWSAA